MALIYEAHNDTHFSTLPNLRLPPGHIVKWPGGKKKELKHLLPLIPPFQNYYEPFVGGGAMYLALQDRNGKRYVNDKSSELISIYRAVAEGDPSFFSFLETLDQQWMSISDFVHAHEEELQLLSRQLLGYFNRADERRSCISQFVARYRLTLHTLVEALGWGPGESHFVTEVEKNLLNKVQRVEKLEAKTGVFSERDVLVAMESALKSAFYGYIRHMYNYGADFASCVGEKTAIFFFIRETTYSAMFRYNHMGMFNAPYSGASANKKTMMRKSTFLRSEAIRTYLSETVIADQDFETFLQSHRLGSKDFIFLDPPYTTAFRTYAQNEFGDQDQCRLAEYLRCICPAKFMLVINDTAFIRSLYADSKFSIRSFEAVYQVNFQSRNNRNAKHLIITNYLVSATSSEIGASQLE